MQAHDTHTSTRKTFVLCITFSLSNPSAALASYLLFFFLITCDPLYKSQIAHFDLHHRFSGNHLPDSLRQVSLLIFTSSRTRQIIIFRRLTIRIIHRSITLSSLA